MENIFVEFLPPWVETGIQPAFYDKESGTVLQQTARMYARVNMLIRMFNKLSKQTKEEIESFESDVNATVEDYIERFNTLYNYVHDYFDNLDVQEEINNKLDQMLEDGDLEEIISKLLMHHFVPVENYGAKGDGTTDDTQAIQDAIDDANPNSVILMTKTYKITNTISIDKKLTITGGGIIKPETTGTKNAITSTSDIVIEDITIDGALNPQDQFDETTFSNLVLLTGLYLEGENDILENVTIKNIYGYGIKFRGYKQISINNSRIDSVGGHWIANNEYDSFGDAIYLGGTNGDSYININNTVINGKYKSTTLSRAGICVENLTGTMIDGVTNIRFTQGTLQKFDRILHVESVQGSVKAFIDDVSMMGNCIYVHGNDSSKLNLNVKNSYIEYTDYSYNGTYGIRRATIDIRDSEIKCGNQSIAFSGTQGIYSNCKFTNVLKTQFNNATDIKIYDSSFDVTGVTGYFNYGSTVNVYNSTFTNTGSNISANRSGNAINIYNCTFTNYLPHTNFKDVKSTIKMASGQTYDATVKLQNRFAYFYINDVKQHEPNLGATIPAKNVEDYQYVITSAGNTTHPLVPTIAGFKLKPNAKYAVINYGTDNPATAWNFRKFSDNYLNIITTDDNGDVDSVGTTEILGTPTTSFALTVDTANKTVAKSGTYASTIIQAIIDINDLNYLATYSA